jgi:transposase InsO family protein
MASKKSRSSPRQAVRGARRGRVRARRRGRVPAEVRSEILRLVAGGRTALEVAREFGVHNTTISHWRAEERAKDADATPRPTAAVPAPANSTSSVISPPPRETGRYSRAFKEEVLAQARSGRKLVEVARQYDLPEVTITRWQKAAEAAGGEVPAPASTRPATGASPIDPEHRALVLELKAKHPNMGLAQVQNQLKRFQALKLSRHMIGRIFSEAGIPLEKRARDGEQDPAKNRFEMTRPGELWAVDFKEIWIHSEKAHALFILDDFSRFIVGFALTEHPTADLAIETVRRAIARYGRPERILSDRGGQFHAWNGVSRFDEFLADFLVDHTVTKARHPFTNGKVEALLRSLESEVLDVEEFASLREAEERIRAWVLEYNFLRTHTALSGLVPADRYFGMVEEAERALHEGLRRAGAGLSWLGGLVSVEGRAWRPPTLLQLVLRDEKIELVVLGRRFTLGG